MKVFRFVIGLGLSTLGAASVACAQQATARATRAEECAKQEKVGACAKAKRGKPEAEVARATAECAAREAEVAAHAAECIARDAEVAARVAVEWELRDAGAVGELVERSLRQAAECAAAADAEMQDVMVLRLQDAEKIASEACRAQEVATHLQEALARRAQAESMGSLENLVALEQLAELAPELGTRIELARAMQGLGREDDSSRRLKERVRALEERLGIDEEQEGRSLEERVTELERRTMAGEELRGRVTGQLGKPGRFGRRAAPFAAQPPAGGAPGTTEPSTPAPKGLRAILVPRNAPTPAAPDAPGPGPGAFEPSFPGAEPPEPPEAPAPQGSLRSRHRDAEAHALTAERRRELEEVMQRMRSEMERMREEMNRLREELGNSESMRSLRKLGYIGGVGGDR